MTLGAIIARTTVVIIISGIFTDINVAAVEAEFKKFSSIEKGIIDPIPAAVEAVKQETIKKIKLFSSDEKADLTKSAGASADNVELITKLAIEEVKKYLNK